MSVRFIVEKDKIFYICQQITDVVFKCGKCGRGNLFYNMQIGDECRVCKAKVKAIDEMESREVRSCGMCHEELVDGETLALHYKYWCKMFT